MSQTARRIVAAIMALFALLVLAELVFVMTELVFVMTVGPHHTSSADDTSHGALAVGFLAQSVTGP